ncbi:Conserved_hypothetical protein [Hexamita inflata]|uniref:Uncharacterized protein n=1 Tax=Hexamita inflata TaxID=28002 RepID=A0AA86TH62_9EUKA|nr:Conserved hypothetical protein [Hexamita inflata]
MPLKVTRTPFKVQSSQIAKQQEKHVLSIYFGRYRVFAKLIHKTETKNNELAADCPAALVAFKKNGKYEISLDQNQQGETMQFSPFFDQQLGSVFVGDENANDTQEITLTQMISVYIDFIFERLILNQNDFVDVLWSQFTDDQVLTQTVQPLLEAKLEKISKQFSVKYLTKAESVPNYSYKIKLCLAHSEVNDERVQTGVNFIQDLILQKAKEQFGEQLYNYFFGEFISQNFDQNYTAPFCVYIPIPEEQVIKMKKDKMYIEIIKHKQPSHAFRIKLVQQSNLQLVIAAHFIQQLQIQLLEQIILESGIINGVKQIKNESKMFSLPPLSKPQILIFEDGIETLQPKIVNQAVESKLSLMFEAKTITGPEMVDIQLKWKQIGERTSPVRPLRSEKTQKPVAIVSEPVGSENIKSEEITFKNNEKEPLEALPNPNSDAQMINQQNTQSSLKVEDIEPEKEEEIVMNDSGEDKNETLTIENEPQPEEQTTQPVEQEQPKIEEHVVIESVKQEEQPPQQTVQQPMVEQLVQQVVQQAIQQPQETTKSPEPPKKKGLFGRK